MPAEKMFTTTIAVEGRVDESLARALGTTVGKLKEFQLQFNGMMRMSDKMQLKANNFLPPAELAKAQRGLATFQSKMAGMMSGTKSMMTTAMGTGLGFLLAEGFNFAISQAEKLKDAVVDAVTKAADFETQKLELGIDVGFSQKQIQEYVGYLYKTSANVPVTVPTALEATRLISSSISISDPIKKEEQIKKTLEMLENIAAAKTPSGGNPVEAFNEHLKGMTESFTKMQKAGVVLERNIYPLEAGGVNVRPAMIETLEKMKESGVDIDPKNFDLLSRSVQDKLLGDLAKNVKKRAVPSSVLEEIMFAMVQPWR